MSKQYVYQIKGILEKPNKDIGGIRILICSQNYFDSVDVPAVVFDKETLRYLRFRLAVNDYINVNRLPISVVNRIREPMNKWLDNWVIRENFLGDSK